MYDRIDLTIEFFEFRILICTYVEYVTNLHAQRVTLVLCLICTNSKFIPKLCNLRLELSKLFIYEGTWVWCIVTSVRATISIDVDGITHTDVRIHTSLILYLSCRCKCLLYKSLELKHYYQFDQDFRSNICHICNTHKIFN